MGVGGGDQERATRTHIYTSAVDLGVVHCADKCKAMSEVLDPTSNKPSAITPNTPNPPTTHTLPETNSPALKIGHPKKKC